MFYYLVNKWLIHEVRSSNTQVENIEFLVDGVVEGIKKPGGIRNLYRNKSTVNHFMNIWINNVFIYLNSLTLRLIVKNEETMDE